MKIIILITSSIFIFVFSFELVAAGARKTPAAPCATYYEGVLKGNLTVDKTPIDYGVSSEPKEIKNQSKKVSFKDKPLSEITGEIKTISETALVPQKKDALVADVIHERLVDLANVSDGLIAKSEDALNLDPTESIRSRKQSNTTSLPNINQNAPYAQEKFSDITPARHEPDFFERAFLGIKLGLEKIVGTKPENKSTQTQQVSRPATKIDPKYILDLIAARKLAITGATKLATNKESRISSQNFALDRILYPEGLDLPGEAFEVTPAVTDALVDLQTSTIDSMMEIANKAAISFHADIVDTMREFLLADVQKTYHPPQWEGYSDTPQKIVDHYLATAVEIGTKEACQDFSRLRAGELLIDAISAPGIIFDRAKTAKQVAKIADNITIYEYVRDMQYRAEKLIEVTTDPIVKDQLAKLAKSLEPRKTALDVEALPKPSQTKKKSKPLEIDYPKN